MKANIKRSELLKVLILSIVILIINVNPLMVNAAVYSVSSSFEKHKVDYLVKSYSVDETEHFIFKYTDNDTDNMEMIKNDAEKHYKELSKIFNYEAKGKLMIIVFPSIDTMNMALSLPRDQQSMGIYGSGFLSILSPNAWIKETNRQRFENIFEHSGPIAHELTHFFVDKRANGNYPAWYTEGVALYFEKQLTGFEWGKGVKYTIKPYTVKELTENFQNLDSDYAYRRSYEIISGYVDKYGEDKLLNTMDRLGEGYSLEDFGN